jgi:hypothetical protein
MAITIKFPQKGEKMKNFYKIDAFSKMLCRAISSSGSFEECNLWGGLFEVGL